MGLNHLQSLIGTYSTDDLRPLMTDDNLAFPHHPIVKM